MKLNIKKFLKKKKKKILIKKIMALDWVKIIDSV